MSDGRLALSAQVEAGTVIMDLAQLVMVIELVRATPEQTEEVRLLAVLLWQTQGQETELAVLYLRGLLPQGRIGVGWTVLQKAIAEGPAIGELWGRKGAPR
ncbi:MAG: hypothetical protein HY348_03935 [Nitrospira defluvii]|nr:hypothetical protein [Nitrospira defluvii]